MKNKFWNLIAKIVTFSLITELLIWQAKKRPYLHIGDYMGRWWLVPIGWKLPFSIRIHHIKRHDSDPYLHDHPWNWRTIVLKGWYIEEDAFGDKHLRSKGFTGSKSAETTHRIDEVSVDGVWTLFIMGKRTNNWGFYTNKITEDGERIRKIYYRDYHSENDRMYLTEEYSDDQK